MLPRRAGILAAGLCSASSPRRRATSPVRLGEPARSLRVVGDDTLGESRPPRRLTAKYTGVSILPSGNRPRHLPALVVLRDRKGGKQINKDVNKAGAPGVALTCCGRSRRREKENTLEDSKQGEQKEDL
jgi:hypothetical protein